jgi:hypothetical protein
MLRKYNVHAYPPCWLRTSDGYESCILFPFPDASMFCFCSFVMIRSWLMDFSVTAALKPPGGVYKTSQHQVPGHADFKINVPEEILLDGRNSVHLTNLTSDTLDLDADMSTPLNDLIGIICELWRRSIAIKLDITGNHLFLSLSAIPPYLHCLTSKTHSLANKNIQRPHINKEPIANHTAHHTITNLTLERSPNHCLKHDSEFCETRSWQDARFRDIDYTDDADDVEISSVCAFDVLVEGVGDVFVGVFVKVGGVEVYDPFHFVEEEHCERSEGGDGRVERGLWVLRCRLKVSEE